MCQEGRVDALQHKTKPEQGSLSTSCWTSVNNPRWLECLIDAVRLCQQAPSDEHTRAVFTVTSCLPPSSATRARNTAARRRQKCPGYWGGHRRARSREDKITVAFDPIMPPRHEISHHMRNAEHSMLTSQDTTPPHLSLTQYATISSQRLHSTPKRYHVLSPSLTDHIPAIIVEHAPWDDTLVDSVLYESDEQAPTTLSGTTIDANQRNSAVGVVDLSYSPWMEEDTLYDIESPQGPWSIGLKQSRMSSGDPIKLHKRDSSATFISTPKSSRHFLTPGREASEGRLHPLYQRRSQKQLHDDKILRDRQANTRQTLGRGAQGFGLGIELPAQPKGPSYLHHVGARVSSAPKITTATEHAPATFNLRQQPRILRRRARIDLRSAYRNATSGRYSSQSATRAPAAGPGVGAGFVDYQITVALLSEMDQGRGGATLRPARRRQLAKPGAAAKGIVRTLGSVVRSLGSHTATERELSTRSGRSG